VNLSLSCNDVTRSTILEKLLDESPKELFKMYHFLHEKQYKLNSEEGVTRYKNFKKTLDYIKKRNAENLTFILGLNQFSDLTKEEYRARLIPKDVFKRQKQELEKFLVEDGYIDFDTYADNDEPLTPNAGFSANWSTSLVSPKDQGQCGSCWTFSAAGALEGNYKIKNGGALVSFSEEQLVDCATSAGDGCNGGLSNLAFQYTAKNGIELESTYPYTATNGASGKCKYVAAKATYKNKSYNYCTNDSTVSEKVKACTLASWQGYLALGPFSVYMEADSDDFQNYSKGVLTFKTTDCANGSDHAVLAVGWGVDTTTNLTYVLVRNSWGTSWGEKGYFRVKYDPTNHDTCYITGSAFQPTF